MKTLKLICMSFDGEYQTESKSDDIDFLRRESAEMGSRWYFFPFHFICTENTVKEAPCGLEWMNGKRIKTVRKLFLKHSMLDVMEGADAEEFIYSMQQLYKLYPAI